MNFLIDSNNWLESNSDLLPWIFGDESFVQFIGDMYDVLIHAGIFKSRSEAKKNWKGDREIAPGIQDQFVGKKKLHLFVFQPIPS